MLGRMELEGRILTGFRDLKTAEHDLDRRLAALDGAPKDERDSFLWALTILDVKATMLDEMLDQLDAATPRYVV